MSVARNRDHGSLVPGQPGPSLIAHGAGNTPAAARLALAGAPDFLEVDLWVHGNRFEARHERAFYPAPLLFEKWYLRWAPRPPFGLAELLMETAGRAGIFLDLKNGGDIAARLIREAIDWAADGLRLVASSQHWSLLRTVKRLCPEVDVFYSIDVEPKLDLFLSIAERDLEPRGVSCNQELLTADVIDRLHRLGLLVVAWTVDDVERAAALDCWGIDGITTQRVAEVRERLRAGR
jgi:glycerophosphoryl diester phosphodiesterase